MLFILFLLFFNMFEYVLWQLPNALTGDLVEVVVSLVVLVVMDLPGSY